jgi:hypothetical protein
VSRKRLGAEELERLRETYESHVEAQWKLFESVAIAAQSFASQHWDQPEGVRASADGLAEGVLAPLPAGWLWNALVDAGNATNVRLKDNGHVIVTAYAPTPVGGCGELLGDFVVTCRRISADDLAPQEGK